MTAGLDPTRCESVLRPCDMLPKKELPAQEGRALEAKKAWNLRNICRRSPAQRQNPKAETFEKGETLE